MLFDCLCETDILFRRPMTDVEGAKPQLKPVVRILPSRMVIHHHNDVFMNPGHEFPGRGVIGKLKKSIQLSDHLARTVRFFTFINPPPFIVSQEFSHLLRSKS